MNYVIGPCPQCGKVAELTYFAAGVAVCSKQCIKAYFKGGTVTTPDKLIVSKHHRKDST